MIRSATSRAKVLALLLLVLPGCGSEEVPEEAPLRSVRTALVFASGSDRTRSFPGTAEAGLETRLSFQVPGSIRDVGVNVGDRVRVGDLIASLDPSDYELQLEDVRAAVSRARAEAREAAANLGRIEELWLNRNASASDLGAARAGSEAADAAVESAEKNAELAAARLADTRLLAPIDGAISRVDAETGENIGSGQTVAVLTAEGRPEVEVSVPEILISQVREGDRVMARFDALPEEADGLPARITEVGVAATAGSGAFPVRVRLETEDSRIRPGMAAEVAFRFGGDDGGERIVVAAACVLEDRAGRFVFVLERGEPGFGIVHRRAVDIGELGPEGLEIRHGLSDGDRLITAGATRLVDGQRVRFPEDVAGETE